MNGWFGFWIFLSIFILSALIEEIMHNIRERWIVKQGYSYDDKRKIWIKKEIIHIDDEEINK